MGVALSLADGVDLSLAVGAALSLADGQMWKLLLFLCFLLFLPVSNKICRYFRCLVRGGGGHLRDSGAAAVPLPTLPGHGGAGIDCGTCRTLTVFNSWRQT